jgi:putative acetyltransferase
LSNPELLNIVAEDVQLPTSFFARNCVIALTGNGLPVDYRDDRTASSGTVVCLRAYPTGFLTMHLRAERLDDAEAIYTITALAFEPMPFSSGTEARIINALRQAAALTISLVAVTDGEEIVGHIAFSPVQIDRQDGPWYGLGPVSVRPAFQKQGIGTALIMQGIAQLKGVGAEMCLLLGDPGYYRRFGFTSDNGLTYRGRNSPYLQRIVLRESDHRGDVSFHPAFDEE